jgi:HD-GYP domain-containing protein (c-di-GMP phosphodiesterase class II)
MSPYPPVAPAVEMDVAPGATATFPGRCGGSPAARRRLVAEAVEMLAAAMAAKDRFTHVHSVRVARYSDAFATRLGLNDEAREDLRVAAQLHDIGKLGMPDALLSKPGPLRDEEFAVIRRHPQLGFNIIRPVTALRAALPVVLHHHERWDGRGYPEGLSGSAIPLAARILAVADALDAMLATRSYQPTRDVAGARAELLRCRGTQFDPEVVDVALGWIDEMGGNITVAADDTTPLPA